MINKFETWNLRGDIYGGITAAVVALPLALAFGKTSGAGPIAGLYGAIFVGFFAALFGGTKSQVSGPTGPMTVVMAGIFTHYVSLDPTMGPAYAFTVVMLGGLMQIGMGVFRLGGYINYVPAPVLSGFMSGIGIIIILLQIGPLFGHPQLKSPLESALQIPSYLTAPGFDALILATIALIIVYFLPTKISKLFPGPLMALIVGTLTMIILMPDSSVKTLGDIPTGIPAPQMPVFKLDLLINMLESAFILAVLGAIDSLLTSLVADNITRDQHDSNKELIGQGIGNTVAGMFGGLPGAGATMRTVVNVKAGGRTPISGALHAVVLLVIVLGAGKYASYIPDAVLAGILIKVGTDIIDWEYFRNFKKINWLSTALMLVVMLLTIFVDLILAVAIGMVIAAFVFMERMAHMSLNSINVIRSKDDANNFNEEELSLLEQADDKLMIFQINGAMSFPMAKGTLQKLFALTDYDTVMFDLSNVTSIDYTSIKAIEDMILNESQDDKNVIVVLGRELVTVQLNRYDVLTHVDASSIFENRLNALQHIQS